MALKMLGRGQNLGNLSIEAAALTQDNTPAGAGVNTFITADTPRGVLGGSVAALRGNGIVGKADETHRPMGWFLNNAQGDPFDNSPAVASGKQTIHINPKGQVGIDIYETHTEDGVTALVYAWGDTLYCSQNGLATKEAPGGGNNVGTEKLGYVHTLPTSEDPFMYVLSEI